MDKKIFQKTSAFFFCILFSILPIIKGNLLASCNTNDLAIKTDHSEVVDDGKKCSRVHLFKCSGEHTNTRTHEHIDKGSVVSYFVIEGDTILIDTLDPLVDLKMSLSTFMLAVNLIDQMRTGYKSEQSKFFLGEKGKGTYEKSTRVAMKLYEVTGNASYKNQAFTFSEKSKAGVLLTALRDSEARQFAGLSDSLVEYERTLKIDLAFYDKMLAEEQQKGKEADSAKIALWSDKLFVLKQKYAVLLDVLESQYPDYYDLKYRTRTLTVREVQNDLLDDNTALVAYATSEIDTCVYIYTVTKNTYTAKTVKVDTLFYKWIKRMRNGIYKKRFPLYVHWAYPIYKTLVEPVVNHLKNSPATAGIKNLIIVPEGLLGYVPFEALLTKEVDENKEDYTALPYLVNDYTISYGYSATLLLDQRNKIKKQSAGNFTAFAPVDFNDQYYEEMVRGGLGNISSLPATETEVNGIATLFGKNIKKQKSSVFTHKQANEQNIKTPEVRNYKFVHIATHGIINEEKTKLSGLLFYGDTTTAEDGILYAGETYNLKLNANVVVLSACETALGKVQKGEGIIGLTRGFLYSGATNLVVSLWRVADESTSNLMIDFYSRFISKKSISQSIKEAKLQMIKDGKNAAPYYWAPFVLIGS